MNRLDRLNAILIQLQSKKIVKAQEIADRFNISLRTVYRDVYALTEGGVPIIGETGVGYRILDGYRLPPVMFTREEATAFLMAEKVLEKYTDQYNADIYRSAMFKIKSVLRSSEKEFIEAIENNIAVLKTIPNQMEENSSMQKILNAINEKKILAICYRGIYSEEVTSRKLEPVGIFLQNNYWYLIAWCHLRNDYRNFKVNRIQSQQLTDIAFCHEQISLEVYLKKATVDQQLHKVILKVRKEVSKYIVTEKYYHGFISEKVCAEEIEMTFLTESLKGMARWILMFGDQAEILEPSVLKTYVLDLINDIQKKLEP